MGLIKKKQYPKAVIASDTLINNICTSKVIKFLSSGDLDDKTVFTLDIKTAGTYRFKFSGTASNAGMWRITSDGGSIGTNFTTGTTYDIPLEIGIVKFVARKGSMTSSTGYFEVTANVYGTFNIMIPDKDKIVPPITVGS